MRRLLLIVVAVLGLGACASTPQATPMQGAGGARIVGFGTLADFGSWEFELAPTYTRLAVLRHRAARQLNDRRISLAAAVEVQDLADRARALLDLSHRGNAKQPTLEQRAQLSAAVLLIVDAEALLGN